MINPFERFYDTEIEVYEVGENTYEKKGEKTLLGSVIFSHMKMNSKTVYTV